MPVDTSLGSSLGVAQSQITMGPVCSKSTKHCASWCRFQAFVASK